MKSFPLQKNLQGEYDHNLFICPILQQISAKAEFLYL